MIEAVVSIALISTVILALAAGLLASVRSSQSAKEVQRADEALSAFAESLKSQPYPSIPISPQCLNASDFSTGGWTSAGVSPAIDGVELWELGSPADTPGKFVPPASCASGVDQNVSRLTVSVTIDGRTTSGQVVVRKP